MILGRPSLRGIHSCKSREWMWSKTGTRALPHPSELTLTMPRYPWLYEGTWCVCPLQEVPGHGSECAIWFEVFLLRCSERDLLIVRFNTSDEVF